MYLFYGFKYSFDAEGRVSSWNLAKIGFVLSQQLLVLIARHSSALNRYRQLANRKRRLFGEQLQKGWKTLKELKKFVRTSKKRQNEGKNPKEPPFAMQMMFKYLRSFVNYLGVRDGTHNSKQRDVRAELSSISCKLYRQKEYNI